MKKTFLTPIVMTSLALVVGIAAMVILAYCRNSYKNQQAGANPVGVSVLTVLQAHNGHNDNEWPSFTQKGTLRYYANTSAESQPAFESRLTLSTDRKFTRYDKATLNRNQSFLFDGHTLVRSTFDAEARVEASVIDGVQAASIKFQIATFGLLPTLKRLSEQSAQVVYAGATSKGNQFQVKTAGGAWYFYTNSNDLIDRLEVNDISITYGDYREVDGLKLPFYQQVKKGDKLLYEIKFETLDLKPVFDVGFFKSDLF